MIDVEWAWGVVSGRARRPACRAEIGSATVMVVDDGDGDVDYGGRWLIQCCTSGDDNTAQWRFHDISDALRFAPLLGEAMNGLEAVIQEWEVRYA